MFRREVLRMNDHLAIRKAQIGSLRWMRRAAEAET